MLARHLVAASILAVSLGLTSLAAAQTDVQHLGTCQKKINGEGAKFAEKTLKSTLKCTETTDNCLIQCEAGVWGSCDPDNSGSNAQFASCLAAAQVVCDTETAKNTLWEQQKSAKIIAACSPPNVDPASLCNTNVPGLHFNTLIAGCQALIPGWQCNGAQDIVDCVGGPLEKQLLDIMTGLLDPRSSDSIGLLSPSVQSQFPDLPIARKVKDDVPAGRFDLWSLSGLSEGDPIVARVETRDDTGTNQSNMEPSLFFLMSTGPSFAQVAGTTTRNQSCDVPNVCGSPCPIFKRTAPFDGTFFLAVGVNTSGGCALGGKYKLVVTTPGGIQPQLVGDNIALSF
jgi:hypothetical protein